MKGYEEEWKKIAYPFFERNLKSKFLDLWKEELCTVDSSDDSGDYLPLTKNRLQHRDDFPKTEQLFKQLWEIIFPTQLSVVCEKNKKDWQMLLDFLEGHSFKWAYFFLKECTDYEHNIDYILYAINNFKLTSYDLSFSQIFRNGTISDLILSPELRPFQKKVRAKKEDLILDSDSFESLTTVLSFFDKTSSETVRLLIHQGLLNFSIIQGVIQNLVEINEDETKQKKAFDQWIEDYLSLIKYSLHNESFNRIYDKHIINRSWVRKIVKDGFSEQYTKKAFAHFLLNENKSEFFFNDYVSLTHEIISKYELLIDCLNALPTDVTEIRLYDLELDDEALCLVLESLKHFSALTHLSFDQTLLKGSSQEKFKEILATLPLLKSVSYKNTKNAQEKQDMLSFLREQKQLIGVRDVTEEENLALFDYNQACAKNAHKRLNLDSVIYLDLSNIKTRNHIFDYLSKVEVKYHLTFFSGDISGLTEVSDVDSQDSLSQFLTLLSQLTKLTHLHLEVTSLDNKNLAIFIEDLFKLRQLHQIEIVDRSLDDEERNKMWGNAILALQKDNPALEVAIYNERPVPEKPTFSPLPNETLSSAFMYETSLFCEERQKSTDDKSTLNVTTHTPATLGSCISSDEFKAFRPFKDEIALDVAFAEDPVTSAYKKYGRDFFDTVIVPIFEERERLVGELKKLLIQTHFDDDDAEIICCRVDLLSGFLDKQEKNLESLEDFLKIFGTDSTKNQLNLSEENPLILNLRNSFTPYTDTKVPVTRLPINTQYLNKRLPEVERVFSRKKKIEDYIGYNLLSNESLHKARHAVGSFLNKVFGAFLMLPSALINVSTFGHYNAIGKTYAQFFIPKTERKLLQIQEKAQQLSPTILKV